MNLFVDIHVVPYVTNSTSTQSGKAPLGNNLYVMHQQSTNCLLSSKMQNSTHSLIPQTDQRHLFRCCNSITPKCNISWMVLLL